MEKQQIKFTHTLSLTPKWRQKFIDELGAELLKDERIMVFKAPIATGASFFTELSPGLAVLLIDATIKSPILFKRTPSQEDFWIINYDLNDNDKQRSKKIKPEIADTVNYGLGVVDNHVDSTYEAPVESKIYSLRIFIDKKYANQYLKDTVLKEQFKKIFTLNKKKKIFYQHLDSRSKIALFNLKQQQVLDVNFEFQLKSTTFSLLAYFFERISVDNTPKQTYEKDFEAVNKSQEYLLSNLYQSFPGIEALAQIANMSTSKYNKVYKVMFGNSPALFYKNKKLELAHELLSSGRYKYISDIVFELGYSKTTYFTLLYKNNFGFLPSKSFKKK